MPKNAPGRNDPCPCGSGKKYKKCCLSRDSAAGPKVVESPEPAGGTDRDHGRAGVLHVPEALTPAQAREYAERLDRWADAARGAVDEGRLEEAETLADRLRAEYPDQIDGHVVRAMVRVKQDRWTEAAESFEQAIALALKHREDYEKEFIEALRQDAAHARAHEEGRGWNAGSGSGDPHADHHGS